MVDDEPHPKTRRTVRGRLAMLQLGLEERAPHRHLPGAVGGDDASSVDDLDQVRLVEVPPRPDR